MLYLLLCIDHVEKYIVLNSENYMFNINTLKRSVHYRHCLYIQLRIKNVPTYNIIELYQLNNLQNVIYLTFDVNS